MAPIKPVHLFPAAAIGSVLFFLGLVVASDKTAYEVFKDSAEALATVGTGLLGFWGINYTLKRNADHVAEQEQKAFLRERSIIQRALAAELSVIAENLAIKLKSYRKTAATRGTAYLPLLWSTRAPVYEAVTSKLGYLEQEQVASIVDACTEYMGLSDIYAACKNWENDEVQGSGTKGEASKLFMERVEISHELCLKAIKLLG